MQSIVVLCSMLAVSQSIDFSNLWKDWGAFKDKNERNFSNAVEEMKRFNLFKSAKANIADHNEAYQNGLSSFKMGVNKFADYTNEEFIKLKTGFVKSGSRSKKLNSTVSNTEPIPASVDWRAKGAVTPAKKQGRCGACWTFSATGALEGQQFKKTGKLVSLSEQNLLDCSRSFGTSGCDGGDMVAAFQYVKKNKGIDTGDSYPYEVKEGKCRYNAKNKGSTVTNFVEVPSGSKKAMKQALADVGPVSIAIYASLPTFRYYKSGIYYDPQCNNSTDTVNHGVLAVGYGSENGMEYWIVKNSWGPEWGENGFIRISTKDDNCGVTTYGSYPIV